MTPPGFSVSGAVVKAQLRVYSWGVSGSDSFTCPTRVIPSSSEHRVSQMLLKVFAKSMGYRFSAIAFRVCKRGTRTSRTLPANARWSCTPKASWLSARSFVKVKAVEGKSRFRIRRALVQ